MHITKLEAEHVKRLSAVSIAPNGDHVVIGGANGAGKSSVLDSIMYALGGKSAIPAMPLQDGEKNGSVTVEVDSGELTITRRFTEKGSTIKVAGSDGGVFSSPQKMLDELYGSLSFDPVAFLRMKPAAQAEALRAAAGIDTAKVDGEIKAAFDKRRDVNRDLDQLQKQFDGMAPAENEPTEKVDVQAIAKRRSELDVESRRLGEMAGNVRNAEQAHDQAGQAVLSARAALREAEDRAAMAQRRVEAAKADLSGLRTAEEIGADIEAIQSETEAATVANAAYEAGQTRRAIGTDLANAKEAASKADAALTTARLSKADMLSALDIPVDGLALTDDGPAVHGIPFGQCSQAEQLRVSAAVAMAANPKLKVMLIRDGSLLDEQSLETLCQMATKADHQLWLERVGQDEHTTVVIEDGTVKES